MTSPSESSHGNAAGSYQASGPMSSQQIYHVPSRGNGSGGASGARQWAREVTFAKAAVGNGTERTEAQQKVQV
eukprot:CAMPEP_0185779642 /NCGR_PEP_ID=MMETSP1174-20130828/96469_1 /TAXON_ID=35687 /ORGANISM="Dictyocha speculum, Strain CCMP1381" /LENGTH=72 /DNA_ID=CAMNT_0028468857 /DNA_START=82 /DNA_END=299 /DNA_ORIENTATION=+